MPKLRERLALRRLPGAVLVALSVALGFTAFGYADSAQGPATAPQIAMDTRTISFDDRAPGPITTEYESQGVTFDRAPDGSPEGNSIIRATPSTAHSAPNTLWIGCGAEVCPAHTFIDFTQPHLRVKVYAGTNNTASNEFATITAYDLSGNVVDSRTVALSTTENTPLEVFSIDENIWYVNIVGANAEGRPNDWKDVYLDDLTFDLPSTIVTPPPDFGLVAGYGSVIPLTAGTTTPVSVTLRRRNGSTGPILLSLSGLPPGVRATLDPNPATGGDGSTIALRLTVDPNAPPSTATVTLTGTPSTASAGAEHRSVKLPISVGGLVSGFDLHVKGIEVTQGIQRPGILIPNAFGGPEGRYQGVSLAEGGRTVVRVYADASRAPVGGVPNVGMALDGFRSDGSALPGGPVLPIVGAPPLGPTATPRVEQDERTDPNGAFTFVLPSSWTRGKIDLRARVLEPPAPVFRGDPTYIECTTPICMSNNEYRLDDVEFETTRTLTIDILEMRSPQPGPPACPETGTPQVNPVGPPLGPVSDFMSGFVAMVPTGEGKVILRGPRATIYDHACNLNQQVDDWYHQSLNSPGAGDWAIGVQAAYGSGKGGDSGKTAIASAQRPFTAVSHELFHLFGLVHASAGCNALKGGAIEPWPPDELGYLHGIGLDRRFDYSGTAPRIFAAGRPTATAQVYDIMSYCAIHPEAPYYGGEDQAWVSPLNWERAFEYLHNQQSSKSLRALTRRSPAAGAPQLFVDARATPRVEITNVLHLVGSRPLGGSRSAYELVARNGRGDVVARAPMNAVLNHSHPGGVETLLSGQVPAGAVARLEVMRGGTIVASKARSAHAPRVRLLAPRAGRGKRLPGRGQIIVRWRASDADGDPLEARIEYSVDGRRNWNIVAIDHNTGATRVRAPLFSRGRRARIRVVISDGFNETAATSGPLNAVGHPPEVHITDLERNAAVLADGTLYLTGTGTDDRFRTLDGRQLSWYAGRQLLGHGTTITETGALRPGRQLIRLRAKDAAGRSGTATVIVRVMAAVPRFLNVTAPARISRRARQFAVRVQTTYPVRLRVLGQSFRVSRRTTRIQIRVRPGSSPLTVSLVLGAGRRATVRTVSIARG